MREILLEITNEYIKQSSFLGGVQGAGNVTKIIFRFDEGWDGFAKTLTWLNALGEHPTQQVLGVDDALDDSFRVYEANIPAEALKEAGRCSLIIRGYKDGALAKSLTAEFEVKYSPDISDAEEIQDITPTVAEQLQAEIESIKDDILSAVAAAESAQESAAQASASAQSAADSVTAAEEARDCAEGYAQAAGGSSESASEGVASAEKSAEDAEKSASTAAASATDAAGYAASAEECKIAAVQAAEAVAQIDTNLAPEIVCTVSGGTLYITDSANKPVKDISLAGATEQNGTPTPESPIPIQCVKQGTKVLFCGKNLFDQDTVFSMHNCPKQNDGSYYCSFSTLYTRQIWTNTDGYEGQIVLSWESKDTVSDNNVKFSVRVCYTDGTTYTEWGTKDTYSNWTKYILTSNTSKIVDYVMVVFTGNNGAPYGSYVKNFQIEIGQTATEYEPYISGGELTVPCDLYDGDIWHPLTGEVERNSVVLNIEIASIGTTINEGWSRGNIKIHDIAFKPLSKRYSDKMTGTNNGKCYLPISSAFTPYICFNDETVGIAEGDTDATKKEKMNQWLADNPCIIVGTRNVTVYEQFDPVSAVPSTLYGKTSIIQIPEDIVGTVTADYVADTKLYIDNKIAEMQAMILEG